MYDMKGYPQFFLRLLSPHYKNIPPKTQPPIHQGKHNLMKAKPNPGNQTFRRQPVTSLGLVLSDNNESPEQINTYEMILDVYVLVYIYMKVAS